MAKKKSVTAAPVEAAFDAKKKAKDTAVSKRAPLLEGQKAKDFYEIIKDTKAKVIVDQSLFIPQYEDGKKPFGRFIIVKEFRVVLDLTEE